MNNEKNRITDLEMIQFAEKAKQNSYSPYSKFRVGAALLISNGKIFTGCNIENSSYGATVCAERTAIFKAISDGEKDFIKLAIVSDLQDFTLPCGICRQVISEFMPDGEIITINKNGIIKKFSVNELIPHSFKLT